MRRLCCLVVLITPLVVLTGCQGVVKSKEEVRATYDRVLDMDMRQMSDDWNLLWLADRQYRLTKWHLR